MKDIKAINLRHPLYVELDMKTAVLEKDELLLWSIKCMKYVTDKWMNDFQHDEIVILAFQTMNDYRSQLIHVQEAREVALRIHERARMETEKPIIFYLRALGQMVSIIHVKTHAMGHLYYTLKLLLALDLDMTDLYLKEAKHMLLDIKGDLS